MLWTSVSGTATNGLHNAPFHYVIDNSRVACAEELAVGFPFPRRTRSTKLLAFSVSRFSLFSTHGPQAMGRSSINITALNADAQCALGNANQPSCLREVHPTFAGLALLIMALDLVIVT